MRLRRIDRHAADIAGAEVSMRATPVVEICRILHTDDDAAQIHSTAEVEVQEEEPCLANVHGGNKVRDRLSTGDKSVKMWKLKRQIRL